MKWADNILKTLEARVEKGAREGVTKAGKKIIIGAGITGGVGSYIGARAANRKKKIKESNIMLFPFAVGVHSALTKGRNTDPNCLIQEGLVSGLKKILGMSDKAAAIARIKAVGGGPLPASKLGKAMHDNPNAMKQAFKLYGPKSKTIKNAMPAAFGKVKA